MRGGRTRSTLARLLGAPEVLQDQLPARHLQRARGLLDRHDLVEADRPLLPRESVKLRSFGQLCPDGHYSLMFIRNMQRELLQDQLAARLMHEIWTGRWPVGSMLPRELELCKSEGVSRFTVRAAMKKLESAGLIRRTPHVGTMVVSTGQAKSLNRELSSMSDLDRLASNNPRRILDIREFVVSRELSPRIGFPTGETLIRFSMVRTGSKPGDPPIAWTTEYVNRSWQRLVHEAPRHPELLLIDIISRVYRKQWRRDQAGRRGDAPLRGGRASSRGRSGSPALRITRRYLDASRRPLRLQPQRADRSRGRKNLVHGGRPLSWSAPCPAPNEDGRSFIARKRPFWLRA